MLPSWLYWLGCHPAKCFFPPAYPSPAFAISQLRYLLDLPHFYYIFPLNFPSTLRFLVIFIFNIFLFLKFSSFPPFASSPCTRGCVSLRVLWKGNFLHIILYSIFIFFADDKFIYMWYAMMFLSCCCYWTYPRCCRCYIYTTGMFTKLNFLFH